MIRFLLNGLLHDRHRSVLPLIVVIFGVMLTVVFHSWITGIIGDSIEFNARFSTGHVKIMTGAYYDNIDQMPNDLAIIGTDTLMEVLEKDFPEFTWTARIHFAGLVDVPDTSGSAKAQGTVVGFGIDLLSENSQEPDRMNIRKSIEKGRLPERAGEVLLSDLLAVKLKIQPGDTVSLLSSTMWGELSSFDFIMSGTVTFGTTAMDKGTMIADIRDIRKALNMADASDEILGYCLTGYYDDAMARSATDRFNSRFHVQQDEFSPLMKTLKQQSSMGQLVDFASKLRGIMILVFLLAMSIILWNAGLLGGLRRYGEFGMRLAIGEEKDHVYRTMIYESLLIGIIGSAVGVLIGLTLSLYLEKHGIDLSIMLKNATIMMPTVFRARITPETWFIGFVPGVLSTLIGTMLSGIGIYKRQTAQLFKELEQ